MSSIRQRVLAWLCVTPDADDIYAAGAIFHDVGGKSWPVFVREIWRMEREGSIEIHRDVDEMDDVWIRLPDGALTPNTPTKELPDPPGAGWNPDTDTAE